MAKDDANHNAVSETPAQSDSSAEKTPVDELPSEPRASESPASGSPSSDETETEEPGGEAEGPSGEDEAPEKPKKPRWKRVVGIVLGIVFAVLLVLVGYVSASRWMIFNDEADIQGKWYVYGTDVPLTFNDGSIVINSDTSYAYHIDATAKTIEYTFGNLVGQGRYWFGNGRNTLVITDGDDYTMWSTLAEDLSYDARSLFGNDDLPTTDTSIVLTRTITLPPPTATTDAGDSAAMSAGAESSSASTASGPSDQEASEPSEEASETSHAKSTDMLMVSDIMIDENDAGE